MRWPWSRRDENRGTLTLLPDDKLIIGLPKDVPYEVVQQVVEEINAWRTSPKPARTLVFPWPVDVEDKR